MNLALCCVAVDGGWSDWSSWTRCTKSCGHGGTRVKKRKCDNPPPLNGGQQCSGFDKDEEICNDQNCPSERYLHIYSGTYLCRIPLFLVYLVLPYVKLCWSVDDLLQSRHVV